MMFRTLATGVALAAGFAASAGAASMDISRDIVARGAKPEWTLTVAKGTQFTLARPGKAALKAAAPGAAIGPGGASWTAKTAEGQELKVALEAKACNIGGKAYPMTARVIVGAETLAGCAAHQP